MGFQEKVIEGKYNFIKDNQTYCEEFFKLFKDSAPQGNFFFNSEVLSRVETGEFLKIYIDYELTQQFEPVNIRVKRSLGAKKSTERFLIDHKNKIVNYTFNSKQGNKEIQKVINSKFHIPTPSFATSLAMTQHRKIDPVHRTPYPVLSSANIWSFEEELIESNIHIELVNSEPKEIKVNGKDLKAIHVKVFDEDRISNPHGEGQDFYVSKYFQIPYLAEFKNGIRIEVEELKNFQVDHSKLFK